MKERVKWIDIVKFFGIFAIYLGHFGVLAGNSYYFVFTHHVPLFFFVSGCMETFNKEEQFGVYFIKKIKSIMIPFWTFAALAAVVTVIHRGYSWEYAKALIVEVLRGVVRNTYVAGSLWFLTCLFSLQLMFFFVKKLKNSVVIMLGAIIVYYVANYLLPKHPLGQPSMYYNIDSALYYMIYYTIGYVLFPYILKVFELNSLKKKLVFIITGIVSVGYTMGVFFGFDMLSMIQFPVWASIYTAVFATCLMIYAYFVIARMIEDATALADIGRNTLYLCGSEYMIRIIFASFLAIFGIEMGIPNPLSGYLCTGILLIVANKYLVPIEKYIINKIVR